MTGIRSLAVVSRRALVSVGAALTVAFIALTPGAALAGDGDRLVSKMRITIATGGDDLRNASLAVASFKYTNASGNQLTASGHLNNGVRWPDWTTRTVTLSMPTGMVLSRLLEFSIQFTSGQPDIFATGDNWNMNSVLVTAILDDESEVIIVQQANTPYLHRFYSDHSNRWATAL